ncbi:hypothetical protein E2P64_09290 [Candidatus Bathyarchaeota archaeon]|nr:hypothetical protein E2P64_09290 [Candidatus Bathyarchaeota archaeon]
MSTFLDNGLFTLGRKQLAIVLRTILDRHPIIIYGELSESVDSVAESLVQLVPHRREMVFGSDFVSYSEHEQMVHHEKGDYNGERMIYRAPSSSAQLVSNQITDYKGWVIATDQVHLEDIKQTLAKSSVLPLTLRFSEGKLKIESNGDSSTFSETNFEHKLLEKVTSETRTKIERITRILKRAAQGKVSERLEKSLVDLNQEEERIRQSLYREHIQAFVEAAWRVMIILLRLRLLQGVGVKSVISDKMLQQAVDYKGATINRLMEFIIAEWGEDFQTSVQDGTGQAFGDRLEGFWTI